MMRIRPTDCTGDFRTVMVHATAHARRLGHPQKDGEHLGVWPAGQLDEFRPQVFLQGPAGQGGAGGVLAVGGRGSHAARLDELSYTSHNNCYVYN